MNKHDKIISQLSPIKRFIEENYSEENEPFIVWSLGMTIRNNYLWNNEKNIKYFRKYYNLPDAHVDTLSEKIIFDIINEVTHNSSK